LNNIVHPRSISYNGFSLVPQGFIGLPLFYGFLSRIFGIFVLKFFTPFLAILGALAFYGLIGKAFNHKIAFLSMLFLLLFPTYWYYSSRYLYPNIPFLAFLLIALWALSSGAVHKDKSYKYLFAFALSLGISLAIRPIEALWAVPIIIIGLFFYRKNIASIKIFYALVIMFALAIPVLTNNYFMYGDPLGAGYSLSQAVDFNSVQTGGAIAKGVNNGSVLLPYGFNAAAIAKNVYKFLIEYFWWFSLPAIFGFILMVTRKMNKNEKVYIFGTLTISFWLIIFYGSGVFYDNPNMALSIGDSHFRYWLPIFTLMMPFVALFWVRLFKKLKQDKILLPAMLIFTAVLSVHAVYWSLDDGLLSVQKVLQSNYQVKNAVSGFVPANGVIVTGRQDKIFFPERKVIYAENGLDNKLISDISKIRDIRFFYYGLGFSRDEVVRTDNLLRLHGLKLQRIQIFGKEVLYKLQRIDEAYI